jgi:hypothetical protein
MFLAITTFSIFRKGTSFFKYKESETVILPIETFIREYKG